MVPLLANSGTPLLIVGLGMLLWGNLAIAAGEALLLRVAFGARPGRFGWMAVANYASAGVGWVGVTALASAMAWDAASPYELRSLLLVATCAAFAFTVLVEWPFVAKVLDGRFRPTVRALRVSLVVQAASYAVLVPLGLSLSTVSAVMRTSPAPAPELAHGLVGRVYYIAPDGVVRSVALDGTGDRRETAAPCSPEIWIEVFPEDHALAARTREAVWRTTVSGRVGRFRNPDMMGLAADLSGTADLHVFAGFWSAEGLEVSDRRDGTERRLAFETPFVRWSSRAATVLPGRRIVYSLGPHVVLLDVDTRRLALLARGRGPVVSLESP